ncbi:hypothetical protein H0H93_006617 [Arthromyces matolae]|nr:hypothetical protein H0H93_006617 [Arthromyces matolae]
MLSRQEFVNADGFGITWYTESRSDFNPYSEIIPNLEVEEDNKIDIEKLHISGGPIFPFVLGPYPAMYKTTIAKPLNDPSFLSLCANVSSKCIFAHLRAAGFPPVASTNNHPFVFGRHSFMHNGGISDFSAIRKDMLTHVSAAFAAMIEGGTDTEHLAAIYMTKLCNPQDSRGAHKHYPSAAMWNALKGAIKTVETIQRRHHKKPANYLNIAATDGRSLIALCYSNPTEPIELWLSVRVGDFLNRKPYAISHGGMFRERRSKPELLNLAAKIQQEAKPIIRRDGNNNIIDIEPEILQRLHEEEDPLTSMHGLHVVVASEPTNLDSTWYRLCNRDAVLVENVLRDEVLKIDLVPETL